MLFALETRIFWSAGGVTRPVCLSLSLARVDPSWGQGKEGKVSQTSSASWSTRQTFYNAS